MLAFLKKRIALRTTVAIIALVSIVGIAIISIAGTVLAERSLARQERLVHDLLNALDNTLRLAVFLEDPVLARELQQGLEQNTLVEAVTILVEGQPLVGAVSLADHRDQLQRTLYSPFDDQERIGSVVVLPDRKAMQAQVVGQLRYLAFLFLVLLGATAASAVAAVLILVVRPLARISSKLHALRIESGEQLPAPRHHGQDELGRLVQDINQLLRRLVEMLGREREARSLQQREERRLRAIFDNAQSGIFQIDDQGRLESRNPAFDRLFNLPADTEAGHGVAGDGPPRETGDALRRLVEGAHESQKAARGELVITQGGEDRWLSVTISPLGPGQFQGIANDITEQRQAREAAEALALTDGLTGCLNRLGFERALDAQLADQDSQVTIMMLDLDHFKEANDQYGHQAGDEVLRAVARRIQRRLRESDRVARLGGDEFVTLLRGTLAPARLETLVTEIIEAINQPVAVGRYRVSVGASIGIAQGQGGVTQASELIRRADIAMYRAKETGRNRAFFDGDGAPTVSEQPGECD